MTESRYSAGDFDPVSASVFGPTEVTLDSGESSESAEPTLILGPIRIIGPRGMYVSERENQNHPDSVSTQVIGVRTLHGGGDLTGRMWFSHRGKRYDIQGTVQKSYKQEITFYYVMLNTN